MSARTYLDSIVAFHRERASKDLRDLDQLLAAAENSPVPARFGKALAGASGLAIIAEVKRRSPSKGDLDINLNPADLALSYKRGGAACLSVLTDGPHFGGSPKDLIDAKSASGLPTLRKDFTVSKADVADARIMGADAVLLIAAALDDPELEEIHRTATELSLDVIVEVHDESETRRALDVGASIVGVNQRDLKTFEVDRERAVRLAGLIPESVTSVAESGIETVEQARILAESGFRAVLVGEHLIRSTDRSSAVAELAAVSVPQQAAREV